MAGAYVGGTVTARVKLDTKQFTSAVTRAVSKINELKTAMNLTGKANVGKGIQGVATHLKNLSKTVADTNVNLNSYKANLSKVNQEMGKLAAQKNNLNTYKNNMAKINKELEKQVPNYNKITQSQKKYTNNLKAQSNSQKQATTNLSTYQTNMAKVNRELSQQVPKLSKEINLRRAVGSILGQQSEATAKLAAEQHRVYTKNHINNLNTYKSKMGQINTQLKQQTTTATDLASAQHRLYSQSAITNINAYKTNMARINTELRKQLITTKELSNAKAYRKFYRVDDNINLNTYKGNMAQINSLLAKQTSAQNRVSKATQRTSSSLRKMGNQTNYVNKNLWKLRGIILGVRTIFLSFGGIYIWQFFEEMLSTTKQTLAVKSEMEQFLKMNDKLGKHGGGIEVFNKGLDQTINKFKKLNKYTLGETVASIGKEFNLSAREMTKSMDVIAMVQSEYVRAGRNEAEAALAVKDILQGEFRRLSMETGVGEKELKALGWSGKKEDVMGMMAAIEKAGKARHWDDFAKKATSLTDVFNILKNRMAEFGAEMADAITPMIVGAFNTMADAFDFLKAKYNGLSAGMRVGINFTTLLAGFGGLSTVILKLWKGFGLLDVASVGFKKSLMAALFNLNLADVKTYGFTKTLMGVVTKTNASKVANQGFVKTLGSWVLGVDAAVASEKGFLTAIAKHGFEMRNAGTQITAAEVATLKWYQKLAMARTGVNKSTAANYGFITSIRKSISVLGLLKKAVFITGILALAKGFINLSMYMDKAKKNIEGFYQVVDDGDSLTKEANDTLKAQHDRVTELGKQIEEYKKQKKDLTQIQQDYNQAVANEKQAQANVTDITTATERAKKAQKELDTMMSDISLKHQRSLADIYQREGEGAKEASVHASKYNQVVTEGYKQQTLAYHEYNKRLEKGVMHIQEHIGYMKQSGATSKQLTQYAEDYDAILQETSKHWKKFWEGDIWSGASAILGELKLAFIDLSYNEHFIALTKELDKTWKAWQPTLRSLGGILGDLLNKAMDLATSFLSTDIGKTTALWGSLGLVVGAVGIKVGKFLMKGKGVISFFTSLGSRLSDVIPKLKKYGDLSKNAPTKSPTDVTGTGSIGGVKKGKFWDTVGQDARNIGRSFAKASMYLASAMILATEAIILIQAPMSALASTGEHFKNLEPQIRKGIDGLKLIAPVLGVILPPVVALMVIMEKYADTLNPATAGKAILASAIGIAVSLGLVAEAIALMVMPLNAIAGLGDARSKLDEGKLQQGISSINFVGEALKSLAPFVPIFALGVGLIGAIFVSAGIGTAITVAVIGGIALGMGILAESIATLAIPLRAIEGLGSMQVNMDAVNQGANVIRVTGEALKSVASAVNSMGEIIWDDIKIKIGEFITGSSVIDEIAKEGGLIDKIVDFNTKFNTKMTNFQPIDVSLVPKLTESAEAIKQVGTAIDKISSTMSSLPSLSQNEEMTMLTPLGAAMVGAKKMSESSATDSASLGDYLSNVEKIIKEVSDFNSRLSNVKFVAPPTALIGQIQQSANFLSQLKSVVDKLQGTMQSAVGTQVASGVSNALNTGAITPMGIGLSILSSGGGGGSYKSSIGSALQNMEDVIDDLVTFNNRINGKSIGDSPKVDGLINFVNAVQDAIRKVQSTLSSNQPVLQSNANSLAQSLTKGFQQGVQTLKNVKVIEVIIQGINANKGTLLQTMTTLGWETRTRFTQPVSGMSDAMKSEMGQIGNEIDSGKTANGSKAYGLGQYLVSQFKAGAGIASPGYMARAMVGEVGYIKDAIQTGINTLPTGVQTLATAMVNQFNPKFNTDFLNFTQNTDGLKVFNNSMEEVQETSTDTLTATNTTFTQMQNTINTTFDNIANNTTKKYSQLQLTTKNSLHNMMNQTTKNIGQIKTSWKGMQTALIQSAENIRSQTSAKIHTLQNNMASFWRKIKNPAALLGSAGSPTMRIRRNPTRSVGAKRSVGSTLKGKFAGGSPSPKRGSAGGSSSGFDLPFRKTSSSKDFAMKALLDEYLTLLFQGQVPYAGGWNFNWSKNIQKIFMGWHPSFPKPFKSLNNTLSVGSFADTDFPVKGNANFAKKYIYDAIKQTSYKLYFNSHHNNDPLAIWRAGKFNCWDGNTLVIALANALGFPGGHLVHGYWGTTRHVWARIPGLGDIDSTAIQQRGTMTAPSVVRPRAAGGSPHPKDDLGATNNYNIEVTVHVEGNADERVMEEAGEIAGKKIIDLLKPSMATGR